MRSCFALLTVVALLGAAKPANGPPIQIYAILSMTGAGSFLGVNEVRTLKIVERLTNAGGGIRGRRVEFVTLDDQSTPQVDVQLTGELIAKNVPVFIGPTIPQACQAALPLVEKAGPVMICLNPSIHPAPGSFAFSAGQDSKETATVVLRYLKGRGFTRLAVLNATDGSGQDMDHSLDYAFALPEFKNLQLVDREHFAATDLSVSGQIARIKAASPQVLLTWCAGTPLGTVLLGANAAALNVPIVTTGGNMNRVQMQQYASFLPKEMLFTSQIAWIPGTVGPGPIRDLQDEYYRAIRAAGYVPDAGYTLTWDPGMLLIDAYNHLGPDPTAVQIRDFLVGLHGWVGIDGIYDYHSYPQHGIGATSGQVAAWDAAKQEFVPVSKRAGSVK
ncbi:MAG: ABC transporter substrate-binding protein [Candidatus Lustribacter sp.]|jgi:branched-chain amino acid transport system substrate-binding protein